MMYFLYFYLIHIRHLSYQESFGKCNNKLFTNCVLYRWLLYIMKDTNQYQNNDIVYYELVNERRIVYITNGRIECAR